MLFLLQCMWESLSAETTQVTVSQRSHNKIKKVLLPFPQHPTLPLLFGTDGRVNLPHLYLADSRDSLKEGQHGPHMVATFYYLNMQCNRGSRHCCISSLLYFGSYNYSSVNVSHLTVPLCASDCVSEVTNRLWNAAQKASEVQMCILAY